MNKNILFPIKDENAILHAKIAKMCATWGFNCRLSKRANGTWDIAAGSLAIEILGEIEDSLQKRDLLIIKNNNE